MQSTRCDAVFSAMNQLAVVSSFYWMAATTGMNIFRTRTTVGTLGECLNPSQKLEHVNVFNSNLTEISKSHQNRVCLSPQMRKHQQIIASK